MPRVSILLTCYNHLPFLEEAVRGIAAQTFTDFEVIAVDDGSSDGTREWLSLQKILPVRNLFNETNLGTYGSLNAALALATGDFVAVLNDDDVWLPEKLARQVALFDANPKVGLVHTNGYFIDGKSERIEGTPLGFSFPKFETGNLLAAFHYENKVIASAALVRRSVFEELGGFNEAYFGSGDWEMWFRIAERYDVGFVAEPLTLYRVHGQQASHKLERIWRDDEKLRSWIAARGTQNWERMDGDASAALAHNWAALGTVRFLNGNARGSREAYRESLRIRPGRWQSWVRLLMTFLPRTAFRDSVLRKNTHGLRG
jgi:glycosyltransferase involved in cell wall biosynthesis